MGKTQERAGQQAPAGFREFYVHLNVGAGWATLAVQRDRKHPGRVFVGIAWCSPVDQYARARGRLIAHGRRAKVEELASLPVPRNFHGSGFIFAASGTDKLDLEAVRAFEGWLAEQEAPGMLRAKADLREYLPRWLVHRLNNGGFPVVSPRRSLASSPAVTT